MFYFASYKNTCSLDHFFKCYSGTLVIKSILSQFLTVLYWFYSKIFFLLNATLLRTTEVLVELSAFFFVLKIFHFSFQSRWTCLTILNAPIIGIITTPIKTWWKLFWFSGTASIIKTEGPLRKSSFWYLWDFNLFSGKRYWWCKNSSTLRYKHFFCY